MENRTSPSPKQNFLLYFNLTNFHRVNVRFDAATGDALLKKTVEILKKHYPGDLISRVAADHFVIFTDRADAGERAEASHQDLALAADEISPGIPLSLRSGMCEVPTDYAGDISVLVDYAKVACSSWSGGAGVHFHLYQDVQDSYEKRTYIIEHVDEAISSGEITVFYQPVIRSLTGQLCGFEGLARWNSKDLGFLSPGAFIPVLEDSYQIWKVDLCILDQICKKIRGILDAGGPVVPISFNLSRHDFIGRDMAELVEQKVASYQVPRELIHIEITESAAEKSRELLLEQVNRFHALGYEVWMDDFGSGYSSLNVLKDFPFDEIKIDMAFLHPFTEASRKIVASIVRMAKTIGVHTLAEGVETKEQVDYLKKIGCEKLQGYYFGRPLPFEEALSACCEKGHRIESTKEKAYYDAAGRVNFMTDVPLVLVELLGEQFHIAFANDPALDLILRDFDSLRAVEDNINDTQNRANRELRKGAEYAILSGEGGEVYTPFNGQERRLRFRRIASCEDRHLFAGNIYERMRSGERLSSKEQKIMSLRFIYRYLFSIDPKKQTIQNIQFGDVSNGKDGYVPLFDRSGEITTSLPAIFPADQERYREFLDPATLYERVQNTKDGLLGGAFRTRSADGKYVWMAHRILLPPTAPETGFCTESGTSISRRHGGRTRMFRRVSTPG